MAVPTMTGGEWPVLKPDWRRLRRVYRDERTAEQLTEHYLLERDLATRLRDANAGSRLTLYGELYSELFARLAHHPRFTRMRDPSRAEKQVAVLKRLVPLGSTFLEIGAGDCSVSRAMAEHCDEAIAIDVTEPDDIGEPDPPRFRFELTDGISLPIDAGSVDFAYSYQLMEHLHPEDTTRQLREINRVLKPGGAYFCITPSKLTGPHDVSRFFDDEAHGFHLKEYTYRDSARLFAAAGFGKLRACITQGRHYAGSVPPSAMIALEQVFATLPTAWRRHLSTYRPVRTVLGLAILATKPD